MIDIPLIICALSALFLGTVFVFNKDMIWGTPREKYYSYEDWFAANNPKGLWYAPLLCGLMWPHNHRKLSFSPVSDFFWERILVIGVTLGLAIAISKWLKKNMDPADRQGGY